jgi:hypothetical protein
MAGEKYLPNDPVRLAGADDYRREIYLEMLT